MIRSLIRTAQLVIPILALIAILLFLASVSPAAQFISIPSLDDPSFVGAATGVSQDGRVVVGWSESDEGVRAFRWTNDDGIQSLGAWFMPGLMEETSQATAISADGEVIVGWTHSFESIGYRARKLAFFWTSDSGLNVMPGSDGYDYIPRAVSFDGSVIIGDVEHRFSDSSAVIFHWEGDRRYPETILGGSSFHRARAVGVSHDGLRIAGSGVYSSIRYAYFPRASFLYHVEDGFQFIGELSGEAFMLATALSADGRLIAGINGASGSTVFRWTETTGIVDVGTLSGALNSRVIAVNEIGSIMVGRAGTEDNWSALIWDEANGFQHLSDYATQTLGIDLQGWRLTQANAITRYAMVGQGINADGIEKAWMILFDRIGDGDTDGDVDGRDLFTYAGSGSFEAISSFAAEFGW